MNHRVDVESNAPEIEGNARDKLEHALWVALLCQGTPLFEIP